MARGYLNRPDLTAAVFIPDFLSGEPGGRLYKTGDRARYLPDGNVEFLARLDHQIKIRGLRVELGEIEAALKQHPAVHECLVLAGNSAAGPERLSAFIVWRREPPATNAELRKFLQRNLPDHMLPRAFVTLEKMPLTPNGKVDRQALAALDVLTVQPENAFVPPRNPVEEALVEIWREVLELDRVSIHDDFFEIGGHSLTASRVVSRIEQRLETKLPLRTLFA